MKPRLIQIVASTNDSCDLFGLDADGNVWVGVVVEPASGSDVEFDVEWCKVSRPE